MFSSTRHLEDVQRQMVWGGGRRPTEFHGQTGLPSVRLRLWDFADLDCYCRVGILNPG